MKTNDNIELELRKFVAPEYIFGINARSLAAGYCKKLGAQKLLLVTDNILLNSIWVEELRKKLYDSNIDFCIYSDISPNPRDFEVMEGAKIYQENNCNLMLALGGGSVIDCAKGIGIVSTNHKPIHEFEGVDMISNPIPPLICIPTTAGTSADVSQFAIINNLNEKYKMAIISKAIVPDVALIDPIILTSMSSQLTANTGMDALSHAFEAYVSNASSPFTDLYSLEAIKLLKQNLPINIQQPNNIQARGKTMLASLYAGLAFSNASLGCTHSLAHSLGGYLDLPHGECNSILLPHVVDFNFTSAEDKYKTIAKVMDLSSKGLSTNQIRKQLVHGIIKLKQTLSIKSTLKDKGVNTDITPTLAAKAIKDPCNATNPKPPIKDDLRAIYNEAI